MSRRPGADASAAKPYPTLLHCLLRWERETPDSVYLTQPRPDGQVDDFTWRDVGDQARRMAAYLVSLRLPPKSSIAILGKNSAHWVIADLAIWLAGHVSVPVYSTCGSETLAYVLDHCEARLMFVGRLDGDSAGWQAVRNAVPSRVQVISLPLSARQEGNAWDEIVAATPPLPAFDLPDPDDLATIVYTSGSTGRPKGVMHSFGVMCDVPFRQAYLAHGGRGPSPADRMLSYLPLAHCGERQGVESTSLYFGFHVYFTDRLETFMDDLRRARPTIFISVPRLWIKFYQTAHQRVSSRVQRIAFALPLVSGWFKRRLLGALGLDEVCTAYTGSAPLPEEVLAWYRRLGLELLDGYGMTENYGYSHFNRPGRVRRGDVGECQPDVKCRISAEGEVLVKTPGQMLGYYKAQEETATGYTDDGYFRTGDRGEIDHEGRLRITGRVKDLFKTAKGKYVAPVPIEMRLGDHPRIAMACVTGPSHPQPFALAVLSDQTRAELNDSAARATISAELEQLLEEVNAQLEAHERLDRLIVMKDPWSVESGELTPTLKIRRPVIEEHHLYKADTWARSGARVVFE